MYGEKRKSHRQTLKYPARIDLGDGTPLIPCMLGDVSATGARIKVDGTVTLPERFSLLLAAEHAAMRHCHLIWRSAKEAGVRFVREDAEESAPEAYDYKNIASTM